MMRLFNLIEVGRKLQYFMLNSYQLSCCFLDSNYHTVNTNIYLIYFVLHNTEQQKL